MFCAPILHSSGIDSLIRPNDTIDGMPLKQLRTGILQRCLSSGLATSYVALIDCTLQHPFRHPFPSRLPRVPHMFLSAIRDQLARFADCPFKFRRRRA